MAWKVYTVHIYMYNTCTCTLLSILQENCNLNTTTVELQTPLHIAAREGYTRVIERLIGYGADPNTTDKNNNTPLSDVIKNRAVITTSSEDSPQTLLVCYLYALRVYIHVYSTYVHVCHEWHMIWYTDPPGA